MKIAVAGCVHGSLNRLYERFDQLQLEHRGEIELLLVCGDFQSVRNEFDLQCMAVPVKYRELGDFYEYYNGQRTAPILTLFIGGNHEASNYLMGLPYGGWVAPNIYYMGYSNVINFKGLRIAGMTGIYNDRGFEQPHNERLPLHAGSMRHVYHSRMIDTWKMLQMSTGPDVIMSHDWPSGVERYGDLDSLLRWKPFFRRDIETNQLGNVLHGQVLAKLRPRHWFAAHLHVRYTARIHFDDQEIDSTRTSCVTDFLSLDKCLPKRKYLEVIDIPINQKTNGFEYDPEWLAILKTSIEWKLDQGRFRTLNRDAEDFGLNDLFISSTELEQRIQEVRECFGNDFKVPDNFVHVQPVLPNKPDCDRTRQITFENPQTTQFCWRLGVRVPNELLPEERIPTNDTNNKSQYKDQRELTVLSDDDDDDEEEEKVETSPPGGIGPINKPSSGIIKLID